MALITQLWRTKPVEYLVRAKYGVYVALNGGSRSGFSNSDDEFGTGFPEVEAYRKELLDLSREELSKRVNMQRSIDMESTRQRLEREENSRSFNRPEARADFDHWAKASYWTKDEAVALSFGRDPNRATWKDVNPYTEVSDFAKKFAARRELVRRAINMGQLSEMNLPGFFIAWADRMKIDIVPELKTALSELGIQIADWKTLFDREAAQSKELLKRLVQIEVEKELAGTEIQTDASKAVERSKSASAIERNSFLKLIIGMAVKGYAYDPRAARSKTASEIASDLRLLGIPVDEDTIRKHLRAGAELLPPSDTG